MQKRTKQNAGKLKVHSTDEKDLFHAIEKLNRESRLDVLGFANAMVNCQELGLPMVSVNDWRRTPKTVKMILASQCYKESHDAKAH